MAKRLSKGQLGTRTIAPTSNGNGNGNGSGEKVIVTSPVTLPEQ